jgi:hypothetical protein
MNMRLLAIDGARRARSAHLGRSCDEFSMIMCPPARDDGDGALTTASAAGWQ